MDHFQKILKHFWILQKIQKKSKNNSENPKIILKIQKSKNPKHNSKSKNNSENQKIIQKIKKAFQKILKMYHFFDRCFHSGGSSVPFGTIINSSRTNPRFGPSFK